VGFKAEDKLSLSFFLPLLSVEAGAYGGGRTGLR